MVPLELGIVAVAIAVLVSAGLYFRRQFWIPSKVVLGELSDALMKLRERAGADDGSEFTGVEWITNEVMTPADLSHAWSEFQDTLHAQSGPEDEFGIAKPARYRQTVPAELYFSPESLVHAPLHTEFFKHFPGILTASAIVFTFAGLIVGLNGFGMSDNVDAVNESVDSLVNSVWIAFCLSGTFIVAAVVTTFLEKRKVAKALELQHGLCVELDKLFDAGVGEDYLQQLVTSSEASATNSSKLKDQLVEKLEELLDAQSVRTEKALSGQADAMGAAVSQGIKDALEEPLGTMTRAVENQSQGAVEGTSRLLETLLSEFTAKLEDTVGAQMRDLNQMMQATSSTLDDTTRGLESLITDMKGAGQETANAMGSEVSRAVDRMADTQRAVNDEANAAMTAMRGQIDALGESNNRVIAGVNDSVEKMTEASRATSGQLDKSSSDLKLAVERLAGSAGAIATTTDGLENAASKLEASGSGLADSIRMASELTREYAEASEKARAVLVECQEVLDRARREGEVGERIVSDLEGASEKISQSADDLDKYLDDVSSSLTGVHERFAEGLGTTLSKGNQDFHKEMSQAVALLSSGVKDLSETIDEINATRPDQD